MTDTLRSIVNEMVHSPSSEIVRGDGVVESRTCLPSCYRCRFEALLAKYEKVELVKQWRTLAAEHKGSPIKYVSSRTEGMCEVFEKCADELETWLAVNLERIKAEARLEGEVSEHKRTCQMYWHVRRGKDARCSEGYTCERLAALEEKP